MYFVSIRPSAAFYLASIILYILPAIYTLISGEERQTFYPQASSLYRQAASSCFIFTSIVLLSILLFQTYLSSRKLRTNLFDLSLVSIADIAFIENVYKRYRSLLIYASLLSLVILSSYVSVVGFSKLALLGSTLDSTSFRFLGFDNVPRFLAVSLELSRKILIPFSIILLITLIRTSTGRLNSPLKLLVLNIFLGLAATVLTFDRFPLGLLLVAIILPCLLIGRPKRSFLILLVITPLILLLMSWFTYIQYNITNPDFHLVVGSAFDFLLGRVLTIPFDAATQLSFGLDHVHHQSLYLQYSRLLSLFNGVYIGSDEKYSIFVAPVGLFGDLWRNFGWLSVIPFSLSMSILLATLDQYYYASNPCIRMFESLLFFQLLFYLMLGTLFSLGPFVMLLLVFLSFYSLKNLTT